MSRYNEVSPDFISRSLSLTGSLLPAIMFHRFKVRLSAAQSHTPPLPPQVRFCCFKRLYVSRNKVTTKNDTPKTTSGKNRQKPVNFLSSLFPLVVCPCLPYAPFCLPYPKCRLLSDALSAPPLRSPLRFCVHALCTLPASNKNATELRKTKPAQAAILHARAVFIVPNKATKSLLTLFSGKPRAERE